MADDIVIARFTAELDGIRAELEKYIDTLEKVQKEEKDTQVEAKKTADQVSVTAKKRNDSIKGATTELKKVEGASKAAFSSKPVTEFNKSVDKTKDNVKGLGTSFQGTSSLIKGALAGVAAGLAAAFSIQQIAQFGKASVDAFIEAETNANRLKFAITTVGGESEAVFDRLIKQSNELQKITIFSDDSIQNAQAALKNFGLTGNEIERLIPLLADFATVSGQSIEQAAQAVGGGLQGLGREFKRYGIEVSATASTQENLNSLLAGFGKFAGAAEQDAKTLGGELKVLENRAGDLQESIGEKLAPAFVKARVAVFEFFNALLGGNKRQADFDQLSANLKGVVKDVDRVAQAIADNREELTFLEKAQLTLTKTYGENSLAVAKLAENILEQSDASQKLLKSGENINFVYSKLALVQGIINDAVEQGNITRSDEVTLTRILQEELKKLGGTYQELNTKVTKEQKQASDIRIAGTEAEIQSLEKLVATNLKAVERIYLASLKGVQSFRDQVRIEQEAANKETIDDFEKTINELNKKRVEFIQQGTNEQTNLNVSLLDSILGRYQEELAATQQLLGELTNLYDVYANSQLERIEKEKQAQLDSIDVQLKANDDALGKRRISEREAALNEQRLLDEKVRAEEAAAKKEREIKRRQAILDKAAALVEIAIQTAINVARYPPPNPLGFLAIATGAAQAAIVAAQPIPYKRGTKGAKGGLSLVGEEGPELTMLPKDAKVVPHRQTKHYSKMIDAMIDDNLEPYISKNFVQPQLEKQRKKFEEQQSRDFAENLSKSIVLNMAQGGKGDYYLERMSKKGLALNNVGELADAIASRITPDIYRR